MTLAKPNSSDYVNAFKNKQHSLIKEFYQEVWPMVMHFILKNSGNEEEAKDIMQNAMTSLYINIRSEKYIMRDDAHIKTYFLQICKFQWYDHLKSAHHRLTNSITEKEGFISDDMDIEKELEVEEKNKYLLMALSKLGSRCQELLQLFYWKDYTLEEIAEHFSYTRESAKNAKYRCLKQFKSLLNP